MVGHDSNGFALSISRFGFHLIIYIMLSNESQNPPLYLFLIYLKLIRYNQLQSG